MIFLEYLKFIFIFAIINNIKMKNKELEQICGILRIPSIPKKKWDGKSSFKDGVAVIKLIDGSKTYAISSFDVENDMAPKIKRVFSSTPFTEVIEHYPLPIYMDTDVDNFDLSDEDKEKAQGILDEAVEEEMKKEEPEETEDKGYFFEEIHNDAEAKAFIKNYNMENGIKGRIPNSHETIIMRLNSIYHEKNK